MQGQVTIRLPRDKHMILNMSSSGVAGPGHAWQCILCDKKADKPETFDRLHCIPARVITIKVEDE